MDLLAVDGFHNVTTSTGVGRRGVLLFQGCQKLSNVGDRPGAAREDLCTLLCVCAGWV